MSTFARDARIQAFHEVGVKVDDALEAARLETARREGAHAAYANSARNVLSLLKMAAESGNSEVATEWVKKCAAACESLAAQAHALVHAGRGAEKQAAALVAAVKQVYDLEVVRKQRETEPVPPPPPEAPHIRTRTIKEERLAAASAARAAAPEVKPPAKKATQKVVPAPAKRRGRPPKKSK